MNFRGITALILFLVGQSCADSSSDFFLGNWQIVAVVEDNKTLKLEENWMHLKADGTFDSYDGAVNKSETGLWVFNPKSKGLTIDGSSGSEDDSEWIVSLRNDTLFFSSKVGDTYLIAKKMD
ncbi:MAG: hypothetical protein AB3N14_03815 [Flavobacteriaceae bacterium]